jgi:hypothetical protein
LQTLWLEAFYTSNERFAKIWSTRIKKAIKGINGSAFVEPDDPVQENNLDKGKSSHDRKIKKKGSREIERASVDPCAELSRGTAKWSLCHQ